MERDDHHKSRALRICHLNITSVSKEQFTALENTLSGIYDIITLSETSIYPNKDLGFDLHLPGYHPVLRRVRLDRTRGRVAAYISSSICLGRRKDLESPLTEQLLF